MMFDSPIALAVFALVGGNALVCGVLLASGWRVPGLIRPPPDRPAISPPGPSVLPGLSVPPGPSVSPGPSVPAGPSIVRHWPFAATRLDVAAEIRAVLEAMREEAADRSVRLELAVAPDLAVHADPSALRSVLGLLVSHAIRQAREQVLASAIVLGGRVQIVVTDDGPGAGPADQQAMLRPAMGLVALQGGTLQVEAWRGEGSTVAVRLPEAAEFRAAPAQVWLPQRAGRRITAVPELAADVSWEI